MFVDKTKIYIKAGDGGDGANSFFTEKYIIKGGPDGGDGGKGGNVIFVVDKDLSSLVDYNYQGHYKAGVGERGASRFSTGKSGKDLILKVPIGTIIRDFETGRIIADMSEDDAKVVVLEGGVGGKGNARFKTSRRRSPSFSQQGQKCIERCISLELKLIADVGLVGFPNVGKSTIISTISGAKPKIADYHFTTLTPSLGVVRYYENSFVVADIPGLIEGAADGQGLGTQFLRHIERVRLILHIIDVAGSEGRDPFDDYKKIITELKSHTIKQKDNYKKSLQESREYIQKPVELDKLKQIIVLNKCDIATKEQMDTFKNLIQTNLKNTKKSNIKANNNNNIVDIIEISAITKYGLENLIKTVFEQLQTIPIPLVEFKTYTYPKRDTTNFEIIRNDNASFEILGGLIEELARNVTLDNLDSYNYFQQQLKTNGIMQSLKTAGAKNGDIVQILDIEFTYEEEQD